MTPLGNNCPTQTYYQVKVVNKGTYYKMECSKTSQGFSWKVFGGSPAHNIPFYLGIEGELNNDELSLKDI